MTKLLLAFLAGAAAGYWLRRPAKARGGPVKPGTPYLVGERGPELFVPATSGYVIPSDRYVNDLAAILEREKW